jgi:transcriptional regulator with XRE-family HTH domain
MGSTSSRNETRGRPPRTWIDRLRTLIWARAVTFAAGRPSARELGDILGEDGKWEGLWTRYRRGSVSPSPARLARIAKVLPGTDRYFTSPLWELIENTECRSADLRSASAWLREPFKERFIIPDKTAKGLFWRKPSSRRQTLALATELLQHHGYAFDALTAILIIIREATLRQDGHIYLEAMAAWSRAQPVLEDHQILSQIPPKVLDRIAEEMRPVWFADDSVDIRWGQHLTYYGFMGPMQERLYSMAHALMMFENIDEARERGLYDKTTYTEDGNGEEQPG